MIPNSPLTIVGVDLALTKTGVAHPDGGLETIRPGGTGYGRHWTVASRLLAIAEGVDLVVLEDYAPHGRGIDALIAVAEVGGVVRTMLHRRGVPTALVRPSSLKLYATGKGNATKAEVLAAARADVGVGRGDPFRFPDNDDEADAYWLRRMALDRYAGGRRLRELPPHRFKAVTAVQWPALKSAAA